MTTLQHLLGIVTQKFQNTSQNDQMWSALKDIKYDLLQYPNSLTDVKAMVQQRIEKADQCGCTDCTVDSLVYQWFLLIAAEKEGEQQEQKDKTHAQGL